MSVMPRLRPLLAVCAALQIFAGIGAAQDKPDPRFTIFVVAAGTTERGFTDPDITRQDSVRDILLKLDKSKVWRSVEFENQAAVTIQVLKREAQGEARIIFLRLIAGNYKIEMQADGDETWGDAAGRLVKGLDQWGADNAERLKPLQAAASPISAEKQ
jgi:hypothetical protein